ncbi:aminotransferase-like domain-containing protein [Paraliomyxa miuraensis]|uniref:aminotransferase-like domain-containing protein n=1 Tax=Paraliomyxa miuraensis TaxID=376150 RepID=UPI002259D938|nr:PLP-dependent aminotransferase family protein [Paraliomyxa miuraensis]MCX4247154.1 PLP-dependent aminotransferase family protein [Paraliomyxa miuraensis]
MTAQTGEYPQTAAGPEAINLGLGQPSPSLLPLALIREAAAARLGAGADPLVLQYGAIHGPQSFRESLAELMTRRYHLGAGHEVAASQLLVTGGISSALSFTAQLFARPGQTVVCSDPTYFLARGVFESQGLAVEGVPVDAEGIDVSALEQRLARGAAPAFVYCMPSFHNPTGACLAPDRARRLVELAERHDFLVVADEPYVMLGFAPEPPPCMMTYDEGRGRVLSLGSFSKILAPGLRLGWAHAAEPLIERFSLHGALRSGGGLNPVIASIVQGVIEGGALDRHIDHLRRTFEARAQALMDALRQHLPRLVEGVAEPRGGYFVWLPLPEGCDGAALLEAGSEAHGVRFTPGSRCAVTRDLSRFIRLSFAFYEPDELREGARRLAKLLTDAGYSVTA